MSGRYDDVHTCHAECPCQTGGEPPPDFLPVEGAAVRRAGPRVLSRADARRLQDQMGVCICGRANQTYCDYGARTDKLAVPECARVAPREEQADA